MPPLQNRVTPLGELVATPERGTVYGNRGCLHDDAGDIRRGWNGRRWIACRLQFKGWHRSPLLQPGRFTELFFLDEATALAAGHRPCALCRREDYNRFVDLWRELHSVKVGADAIDRQLHDERIDSRTGRRRFGEAPLESLPTGAFVLHGGSPMLVFGKQLLRWTPAGYVEPRLGPAGIATVITPPSLVSLLRSEWDPIVPFLHPSSGSAHAGTDPSAA